MTPREKLMLDALRQIAMRDCAGFCGLIARKMIERMRSDRVEEIVVKNEQVIETYDRVFGKKDM